MMERFADRWAPYIIVVGVSLGVCWLGYAASKSFTERTYQSAKNR